MIASTRRGRSVRCWVVAAIALSQASASGLLLAATAGAPAVSGSVVGTSAADAVGATNRLAVEPRGSEAREWLKRMDDAVMNASYEGVFTYVNGQHVSTMRIVHAVINGVRHERLQHLDGLEREIIRIGDAVSCILNPDDEMVGLSESVPSGPLTRAFGHDFSSVPDTYELKLRGRDRVAEREAQVLEVVSKDGDRFGYRLWLDAATGLLLRWSLVAGAPNATASAMTTSGRADALGPVEIFQFATIAIGRTLTPAEFRADPVKKVVHELVAAPKGQAMPRTANQWRAGWLPTGFSMSAWEPPDAASPQHVETLLYSDGLASLSIFVEPVPAQGEERAEPEVMRQGATVVVSVNALDVEGATHLVTVVGEVPDQTAIKIAQNVISATASAP